MESRPDSTAMHTLPDAGAILDCAAAALAAEERRWLVEQAARGLDSLDEVELHPVLAAGFAAAGWGVAREQPYPAEWKRRKARRKTLPENTERQRCDLVLMPSPGQRLRDGLVMARAVESDRAAAAGTLFQPLGPLPEASVGPGGTGAVGGAGAFVEPEDAYWLEVKVVGQYCFSQGVPGPNGAYGSELVRGVCADVRKLRDDPGILRCGVLLVLFAADAFVAEHDLAALAHKCLDRQLPIRSPLRGRVAIADRIGNTLCEVCLFEVAK